MSGVVKPVKLADPIEVHGKRVAELSLRAPTGAEYLRHGEPRILARNADGTVYWVEVPSAISAYIEACLSATPDGDQITPRLSLADARAVKETVLGFFA